MTQSPASLYPALAQVQPSLTGPHPPALPMQVPAGTVLFTENTPCQGFPLVLDGEIKVSRSSGDGRSLELYRVVPGELCLVSSACLFRTQPLSAHGVTTKASTLLLIPPDVFTRWLETPAFRNEVLGLFAERMADLTVLIDAVAFQRLDQRRALTQAVVADLDVQKLLGGHREQSQAARHEHRAVRVRPPAKGLQVLAPFWHSETHRRRRPPRAGRTSVHSSRGPGASRPPTSR
jgi:CRP-like cAMP-binding protein